MVSDNKMLYVVRGARNSVDPTFACTSHTTTPGKYLMLEIDSNMGKVTRRTIEDNKSVVEDTMQQYRGVYVDTRSDNKLMRMPQCSHAKPADLDMFRRAKSDDELLQLRKLSTGTRELLNREGIDGDTFRGVASDLGNRSYFKVHHGAGFTEYRGGMQDAKGRCSDLTRVVPHNRGWQERLQRVNEGLTRVENAAEAGANVDDLERIFRGCIDPRKDSIASPVIHSTGYESRELLANFKRLEPYDFVTIGVAVSDGNDTALVYRSAMQILPSLPATPVGAHAVHQPPKPAPQSSSMGVSSYRGNQNSIYGTTPTSMENGMCALERTFL